MFADAHETFAEIPACFILDLLLEGVIDGPGPRWQSFIVKVWLEPSEHGGQTCWRGRITHVPSGDSNYVNDLQEINSFIAKYLREMGARNCNANCKLDDSR